MDGRTCPVDLQWSALGNVANIEAWEHQYEAAERDGT